MVPPAVRAFVVIVLLIPLVSAQAPTGPPPPQVCDVGISVEISDADFLEFSTGTEDECGSTPTGGVVAFDGRWLMWSVAKQEFDTIVDVKAMCIQTHIDEHQTGRLGNGIFTSTVRGGAALDVLRLDTLQWEEVFAPPGTRISAAIGGGYAFSVDSAGEPDTTRVWSYDAKSRKWLAEGEPFLPDLPDRRNYTRRISSPQFPLLQSADPQTHESKILVMDAEAGVAFGPFLVQPPPGAWGPAAISHPYKQQLYFYAENLTRGEVEYWSLPLPRLDEGQLTFERPPWDLASMFVAKEDERLPTLPSCSGGLWTSTLSVGAVVAALLVLASIGLVRRRLL